MFHIQTYKDHKRERGMVHFHIPIWQHSSCIHLAMATKPPPILINSLHPNNAIQLTLYINQYIHYDNQIQSTPVQYTLHLQLQINALHTSTLFHSTLLYKVVQGHLVSVLNNLKRYRFFFNFEVNQINSCLVLKFSYLSIWIDSKPFAWDSSVVFTDNSDWLALSLTRFLLNRGTQGF